MSQQEPMNLSLPDLPGIGEGWELLLPAAERARRCNGDNAVKCEQKREAIIAACVHLGTRRVAQAFNVSREVVRALRAEAVRTGKLDQLKEETGRRALAASDRILDRIEDEVDQLPRASLPLAYAILQDKGLLLTGQPTSRVEHQVAVTHDDLNAWIQSLPAATPVSSGEIAGQKAAPVGAASVARAGAGGAPEVGCLVVAGDTPSLAFCPTPEGAQANRAEAGQIEPKKGAS